MAKRPNLTISDDALRVVQGFAGHLKAIGRQAATIDSYCRDARSFVSWIHQIGLSLSSVESDTLVAFEEHLRGDRAERENSIRRSIIGVRLFYRHLVDVKVVSSTPFDQVPIPQRQEDLPKALSPVDIEALFEGAGQDSSKVRASRNLAIIAALAYEGIKATELIELTWGGYLSISTGASLHLGGLRSRAITLSPETKAYFDDWRAQTAQILGAETPPRATKIFAAFQGRDGLTLLPTMTRHGLKFVMYEVGALANLQHLNTELLRHHAVSHLLSLGKSIEDVKAHLGLRRSGIVGKHAAIHDHEADVPLPVVPQT